MSRSNYRHELAASLSFPLAAAMAEGSFAAVVAAKFFDASALLIAVIFAAPMFGNIVAIFWAELAERRPKVAFVNHLQLAVVVCVALIALTWFLPREIGVYAFAGLIVIARILSSGIVSTRNVIWRFNFPRSARGRIVGRLTMVSGLMLSLTTLAGAALLDWRPDSYALIYLLCAILGLVGVWQFSRVKVRGEAAVLERVNAPFAVNDADPESSHVEPMPRVPKLGPVSMVRTAVELLRADKLFRRYQHAQMLQGTSFMMMQPALNKLVSTEMTDPRSEYMLATLVVQFIPFVVSTLMIQPWAHLFDRMNIVRFRSLQSVSALITHACIVIGVMSGNLWMVAIATAVLGVSMAGASLAWNLGQNAFATPEKVGTYMGVHLMLTGLRGMLAPFVGTILFSGLAISGVEWGGVGSWLFVITTILCGMATISYVRMSFDRSAVARDSEA